VGAGVAITAEPSILQDIVKGKGPRRAHFTVGYAGWAPGQLEAEMRAGYWIVVPSDDGILFDDAYDTKWDRAMAKRRINL
jgi:putative transcriptional regulator